MNAFLAPKLPHTAISNAEDILFLVSQFSVGSQHATSTFSVLKSEYYYLAEYII